jgi:hypothetical protein
LRTTRQSSASLIEPGLVQLVICDPQVRHDTKQEAIMQMEAECVGQISYDYDEFCKDYGPPAGRMFTFEVTHRAVTYVYADVIGLVEGREVVFSLDASDLVQTRKAH